MYFTQPGSLEARCDAVLLGRLGTELALIYHDTLQSPLPSALQALIDRLEDAIVEGEERGPPQRRFGR